mmetsp:Transcript_50603/g.93594  ORF Transcript_50603/g.93594 Transcript_50603/m.93594 type:complete len:82 (-) Transcript_50603:221-466(-)
MLGWEGFLALLGNGWLDVPASPGRSPVLLEECAKPKASCGGKEGALDCDIIAGDPSLERPCGDRLLEAVVLSGAPPPVREV